MLWELNIEWYYKMAGFNTFKDTEEEELIHLKGLENEQGKLLSRMEELEDEMSTRLE